MRITSNATSISPHAAAQAYAAAGTSVIGRIQPQAPNATAIPAAKTPAATQQLVGAVVPGRVDFSGSQPAQVDEGLQMYRHPADKNAAATSVSVGRKLDVQG